MFGFAPEVELYWVNEVRIYAMAAAACAALVTLGAGYAQVRLQSDVSARKEATAKAVQQASDERIARAQADGAQANERAEKLALEAAQARAEQERLKQLVTWRTISDEQIEKAAAVLSPKRQTVLISVVANDPEAMHLGAYLSEIFKKANWAAVPRSVSWGAWLPIGVHIYGPEGETLDALRAAFNTAGIPFDSRPPQHDPDWQIEFQQGTPTSATILVGSKVGPT